MEISLDDLVLTGKTAFDVACRSGQFFFPKVAVGRVLEHSKVDIGQYEGELGQLQVLLRTMALNGPIDWIAHTADSYRFVPEPNNPEDEEMAQRISRGEVKISDLFEDGDPRAIEALIIIKLNRFGFDTCAMAPYTRLDGRKIKWGTLRQMDSKAGIEGRYSNAIRDAIALSLSVV